MSITKTITLYQFDELPSEAAKEKARQWFRSIDDFSSTVEYDDFCTIAERMGFAIDSRGTKDLAIFWSGFCCQGDGASFTARYNAKPDAGAAIRDWAGRDTELHRIADALGEISAKYPNLVATIGRPYGTRYSHEMTMFVTDLLVTGDYDSEDDIPQDEFSRVEAEVQDLARALARWLYKYLEADYDWHTGDEQVAENIRVNEYTFRDDGTRED